MKAKRGALMRINISFSTSSDEKFAAEMSVHQMGQMTMLRVHGTGKRFKCNQLHNFIELEISMVDLADLRRISWPHIFSVRSSRNNCEQILMIGFYYKEFE